MLLEIIHYELQRRLISVQGQQNEDREHTRVVARCSFQALPQVRPPKLSWCRVIQTPRDVQVEAVSQCHCSDVQIQDHLRLVKRAGFCGDGSRMSSATVDLLPTVHGDLFAV